MSATSPNTSSADTSEEPVYKKSAFNPVLVKKMLQYPATLGWTGITYSPYLLIELLPETMEYLVVRLKFMHSVTRYTITKIYRVENPFLLASYLLKREKVKSETGSVHELEMFHGTKLQNIAGICANNFDWRLRGTARGHIFGQGVSFASKASFATHFTRNENVVILSKVLYHDVTVGNESTVIPPPGFDTTKNVKSTVYVKYEDDDFYPLYVIRYL